MDHAELIAALRLPSAYPVATSRVEVVETHISTVFLLDRDVFKLKKPVDLGFLDYSTLARRRHFCEEEVRLNRRLAPEVYLGVSPIERAGNGVRVGAAIAPGAPAPDAIEFAVHMVRLPDAARLADLVAARRVPEDFWMTLAGRLARFHLEAERSPAISRGGSFEAVAGNARDNLSQTERFIGEGLAPALHARVREATEAALARLRPLIESRASRGVPCDTHGDLRLDHVYLFPDRPPPADLVIIDGIEFSPLLRHADPVADAAFLAMDLRFAAEDAAAAALVDAYLSASGDEEGRALFPWYVAYRSAVRAKVDHFTLAGAALSSERRARLEERALGHWLLALAELEPPERRPALLLVGGPPGCGKSTLASALAPAHGFAWIRSDAVRRELHSHLGGEERYSPARTAEVYRECLARADAILREGGRALIDATFHAEEPRREALELGKRRRVPVVHLALSLDRAEALRRIAGRRGDPSEADVAVHDALVAAWETSAADTVSMREELDAGGAPAGVLERAESALRRRGLIA